MNGKGKNKNNMGESRFTVGLKAQLNEEVVTCW
jgi:hypothetical protein